MPARERRSPSVCEICTITRSKRTEMGCLSSVTAGASPLARPDPFFVVDVATTARYRTNAHAQVSGSAGGTPQAGRTVTPCASM